MSKQIKIDPNLVRSLKQNYALITFIKLKKRNNLLLHDKINLIHKCVPLKSAFIDFFYSFMKENKWLNTFTKEVLRQGKTVDLTNLPEIINYSICWANTTQGDHFWLKVHKKWITYLNSQLTVNHE